MLVNGENPIKKVELAVYSVQGKLMIDSVAQGAGNGGNENGNNGAVNMAAAAAAVGAVAHPSVQAVSAQNNAIRLQNTEILTTLSNQHDALKQELYMLKRVV
jgi:hypothetical protein